MFGELETFKYVYFNQKNLIYLNQQEYTANMSKAKSEGGHVCTVCM